MVNKNKKNNFNSVQQNLVLFLIIIITSQQYANDFRQTTQINWRKELYHNTLLLSTSNNTTIASTWMEYQNTLNNSPPKHITIITSKNMNRNIRASNGNISKSSQLKIIHWNSGARLWENKISEIESLLQIQKPGICVITEANIKSTLNDLDRQITGFKLILPATIQKTGHARIAMLVREDLPVQQLTHNCNEAAVVWTKIGDTSKNSIIIGGAYRQHHLLGKDYTDATWLDVQTEQELRWRKIVLAWRKLTRNRKSILIGDLNLDYLKWELPDPKQITMIEDMKDILESRGYVQLVKSYTRSRRGNADTLLDHIWTSCQERILKIYNIKTGASDHNVIGTDISLKDIKLAGHNQVKRCWKNFDPLRFTTKLRTYNWNSILQMTNVNLANSQLEDWLIDALKTEAPIKTIQTRAKFNHWLGDTTKELMKLRDSTLAKARISNLDSDWMDFKTYRNLCTKRQRNDKSQYNKATLDKLVQETNSKNFFKTSKQILGYKIASPPSSFHLDGVAVSNQKEMANAQARHYAEKITKIKNELPKVNQDPLRYLKRAFSRWRPPGGKPQFSLKSITLSETSKMIDNLSNSHAFGRDNLDASIIKVAAPVISPAITHILNLSLGTAVFPPKWKLARVIPILKGKDLDPLNPGSYRPISLLPILSKLCERSVQTQILNFLEESHQLNFDHHAYRHRTSTTTALLQMMDSVATATDANLIHGDTCARLKCRL